MSEDSKYSQEEVAILIQAKLVELSKSANSTHEIDNGEEASNDLAETPDLLANSYSDEESEEDDMEYDEDGKKKKKKKKMNEESDSNMEYDDDYEESEEEYEYKKSETGMHTIEYKKLKKANTFGTGGLSGSSNQSSKGFGGLLGTPPAPTSTPAPVGKAEEKGPDNAEIGHAQKKPNKMSNAQNASFGSSITSGKKGSMKGHKGDRSPGQIKGEAAAKARRMAIKKSGMYKEEVKSTQGMATPPHKSDKGREKFARPQEASPQSIGKIAEFKKRMGKSEKLTNFLKNK